MADNAGMTYSGDFCLGIVINVNGDASGDNPQYVVSNAAFGVANSFQLMLQSAATATNQSKLQIYLGTTVATAPNISSVTAFSAGVQRLVVLQRSGATLTMRSCPILASDPAGASSVVAEGSANMGTGDYDGNGNMVIGGRSDLAANRMLDHALGRYFYMTGTLTDLEVAKLAYGMEITDLGKSPLRYIKMATAADTTDRGSQANTVTTGAGTLATATEPSYGYAGPVTPTVPVITGTPSITGTVQEGSTVSYVPGAVSGSPSPTTTQQWTLDGADVAGATGGSYTLPAGSAGKALRVRQTATNTQGNVSSTSSPSTVLAAPVIPPTPVPVGTVDRMTLAKHALIRAERSLYSFTLTMNPSVLGETNAVLAATDAIVAAGTQ
jgi:hypothetical protein